MATDKVAAPTYGSFKTLSAFFNARRDDDHITDVVDRSLMTSFSGSSQHELISGLKFLKMINDKGEPLPIYAQYVKADDDARKVLLAQILRAAYPFVFSSPTYNLERATTATTADAFRTQGINGSTLSRAVAFFLAAAKQAGIKVSPNIKAPPLGKSSRPKKEAKAAAANGDGDDDEDDDDLADETVTTVRKFEIPIPGKRSVRIIVPGDFDAEDFDMLDTVLKAYIKRWKGFDASGAKKKEGT